MVRLVYIVMRDRAHPDRATRVPSPLGILLSSSFPQWDTSFPKALSVQGTVTRSRVGKGWHSRARPWPWSAVAARSGCQGHTDRLPRTPSRHRVPPAKSMGPSSPAAAGPACAAPGAKPASSCALNSKPGSGSSHSQIRPIILFQSALPGSSRAGSRAPQGWSAMDPSSAPIR